MTQFIRREGNEEIKYINVASVSEATFDKSAGTVVLTYPTKDGGAFDVYLSGNDARKAKAILDAMS